MAILTDIFRTNKDKNKDSLTSIIQSNNQLLVALSGQMSTISKNTSYLKKMSRDMNIIKQNTIKSKIITQPDNAFKNIEKSNEAKGNTSPSKVETEKTDGKTGISGGWMLGAAAIVAGLAKYFSDPEFKQTVKDMVNNLGNSIFGEENWTSVKELTSEFAKLAIGIGALGTFLLVSGPLMKGLGLLTGLLSSPTFIAAIVAYGMVKATKSYSPTYSGVEGLDISETEATPDQEKIDTGRIESIKSGKAKNVKPNELRDLENKKDEEKILKLKEDIEGYKLNRGRSRHIEPANDEIKKLQEQINKRNSTSTTPQPISSNDYDKQYGNTFASMAPVDYYAAAKNSPSKSVAVEETKPTPTTSSSNIDLDATGQNILKLIAHYEGSSAGYNAMNKGTAGDTPGGSQSVFGKNLTDMTVGEIKKLQASNQMKAAGAYQIIKETLKEITSKAGVKDTDLFDQNTQDILGAYLLKNRAGYGKLEGKALEDKIAGVWAVFPKSTTGRSMYENVGGNKSNANASKELQDILAGGSYNAVPTIGRTKGGIPIGTTGSEKSSPSIATGDNKFLNMILSPLIASGMLSASDVGGLTGKIDKQLSEFKSLQNSILNVGSVSMKDGEKNQKSQTIINNNNQSSTTQNPTASSSSGNIEVLDIDIAKLVFHVA